MKKYLHWRQESFTNKMLFILLLAITANTSCKKEPGFHVDFPPSLYSADVIDKWMTLESRI